ncbi:hypothetical protein C6499_21790 [Candidatus Poribacteria bacterium]|nr:MAG: hypothetical protein C6499_21790 [Candidatus Poribacteria bacterium]
MQLGFMNIKRSKPMLSREQGFTNYLITVFLFLFVITSVSNADDLTVTYAYSLYSGSESVAFSPDGKYIATGDGDGDVGFWEVGDDEPIDYVNLGGEVQGVAFSPDGRHLAAEGSDGNVIVWLLDVATRTTVSGTYVHDDADNINSIAYSPDGNYVAVAVDLQWAFLWDLNSGSVWGWGKLGASEVYDVAFSPDGRYLTTGNDNGDLTLWEVSSWWDDDVTSTDYKPGGNVRSVAFSPDGRYLAADGYDGSSTYVNIYNVDTGRVEWQINSGNVYAIAFSPNGEYIALGDNDGVITFYSIGTNPTHVGEITASGEVLDLAWSPNGTLISDGRDVWNVTQPTPDPPDNTDTNQDPDVTVSFSPSSVQSPIVGERLTLSLTITDGKNVAGYQATVQFDTTALKYVQSANGDYLPDGAFFIPPVVNGNSVTLAATSLAGESNGDGTLATITFEVLAVKTSTLTLSDVLLTDSTGGSSRPQVEVTQIAKTSPDSPNIVFESQTVYDSGPLVGWSRGNSNGVAEVGERIELKVLLKNSGATTAENVKAVLTTRDTSVRILDSSVDYGDILAGFTSPPLLPTIDLSEQTFKIEVPDTATPHDVTLTLYVTANNAGPWTLPIILSVVDQSKIQLAFPDDFISEEAFGTHTTYFTLKVQYPTLTDIPDAAVSYGSCNIILRIPEQTQAFIFPIQTQGEKTQSIVEDVLISVVKLTPGISDISEGITAAFKALDLILFFAEVIESIGLSEYDLKIALPTPLGVGRGHPDTIIDYVVLLKNEVASLRSIDITMEQAYSIGESSDRFEVDRKFTWNFGEGLAAPTTQPIALSEYPAFQLLPLEVQGYLLRHFSVFTSFKALRALKETSLLPNYPNPFNPETWIPYQLATPTDVSISIYAADGTLVRTLDIGHQSGGIYQSKSRAAYWDGRNEIGESVASGVYFYTFTAGDFTQTRRMLILK